MKSKIQIVNKTIQTSSSSLSTEKKIWQQPQIMKLNVQNTKGGWNPVRRENCEDCLFNGLWPPSS